MIQAMATEDTITLYWEKPDEAPTDYEIFCDGQMAGKAEKTHYTVKGLNPDTEYNLEVGGLGKIKCSTGKRKIRVDVTANGALGDGKTLNTVALQSVIDVCGPDKQMYFPAGVYLTGSLRLHSNMEIYFEEGAVLQGTAEIQDYLPRIPSRFEGIERECYSSVLNLGEMNHEEGPNCENVLIHGHGTIAGGGKLLAQRIIEDERERQKEYIDSLGEKVNECENENTIPGRVRPRLVNLSNCAHVRLSGLTFMNGPSWNVHMVYCDDIVTDNCVFRSEEVWNGDGWDPDSSSNCTLFGCSFYTGDDAVAIKSGKNPEGNVINRACRHIRVFDCYSAAGHGIIIGSEISGGIEDVRIWDCDLMNSLNGIEVKGTKKRGGYVRGLVVRDCRLPRVLMHSVSYNDDGESASCPPVFEDCRFEGLEISGQYFDTHGDKRFHKCIAIELEGFSTFGYEIKNIYFKDIKFTAAPSMRFNHCENILFQRSEDSQE